jgi:uncharacterized membrane protein
MEPTPNAPPPNAPPPNAPTPLVEYVRTQRQNAGTLLAVVAVAFLALGGYFALKAFRTSPAAEKPAEKAKAEDDTELDRPAPEKPPEAANLKRGEYSVGWVSCLAAFLCLGAVAGWLLFTPPVGDEAKQRSDARVAILAAGGLLGTLALVVGLVLFYRWSDSLVAWLDRNEAREARWVLIPLLTMVLGAGLIFFAIQPARAEERNNASIRQLVYGANFGLTVLLLLVAFVVVNVVFSLRVPNKLDATSSGFYTVSDTSRELLGRLDSTVTAHAVLPESPDDRVLGDVRQLLLAFQDASGGKFQVKFVATTMTRALADLMARYPQLELTMSDRRQGRFGAVVLTAGPDEKRHAVIPTPEFFSDQGRNFVGESRLFKEVALLADNQVKPVVYFTQSNGELAITPGAEVPPEQSGARLRAYLEKNYLDVRPLNFKLDAPAVPDDAAVVVVAGPRVPFSDAASGALRKYLTTPRGSEGKKGKLILLAGTVAGPGNKGLLKTGLEGLLGEFNVRLGEKFVYTIPTEQHPFAEVASAGFNQAAGMNRHQITTALARAVSALSMPFPREVTRLGTSPAYQASILLGSINPTWLEDDRVDRRELTNVLRQLLQNEQVQVAKAVNERGRPLAVVVSEGASPRLAVYGSTVFASDEQARDMPPETAPFTFDLIGVTVDWLRERPSIAAVGVKSKEYEEYKFPDPATVDATRLVYLPLGLGLLAVVGLGAGVWVIRRR